MIGTSCRCGWTIIDPGVCATYLATHDEFRVLHHDTGVWVELPRMQMLSKIVGLGVDARDPHLRAELVRRTRETLLIYRLYHRIVAP